MPENTDPWMDWWNTLEMKTFKDKYGQEHERQWYENPATMPEWHRDNSTPYTGSGWWTPGSEWDTGQFGDLPAYPNESGLYTDDWKQLNERIKAIQDEYAGFVDWYNREGKAAGYSWQQYVDALSTMRARIQFLKQKQDALIIQPTDINVPDVDTGTGTPPPGDPKIQTDNTLATPMDPLDMLMAKNDMLGTTLPTEDTGGGITTTNPEDITVGTNNDQTTQIPIEQPGTTPTEGGDVGLGGEDENVEVPAGEETTTPTEETDIFANYDWDKILGWMTDPSTADQTEPETDLTTEKEQTDLQKIIDEYNLSGPQTEEEKAIWEALQAAMGDEGGLSEDEKKARREALATAMGTAQSQGAFKGMGKSSKVFAQMARIAAEGEISIQEADRVSKESAANRRLAAIQSSISFQNALQSKNMGRAELILAQEKLRREDERLAYEKEYAEKRYQLDETDTLAKIGFQGAQLDLARQYQNYTMSMGERQFSEQQKQNMLNAGFTQQQIALAEQDMQNRYDLGLKNWDIAMRGQDLAELKNAQDQSLQERMFELQKELGIRSADLEDEKFRHYRDTIEREFGIRLDDQAFNQYIESGRFEQDIIDREWKQGYAERQQAHEFWATEQGLALQEKLGMTELELNAIIQGQYISLEREKQILTKLLAEMQLDFNYAELEAKIKQWRDESDSRNDTMLLSFIGSAATLFGGGGK